VIKTLVEKLCHELNYDPFAEVAAHDKGKDKSGKQKGKKKG
jgi:hypothetical protein